MIQHYFNQIFRNFKRFKSTFIINWLGLSTGLACSFLIYLWVMDELTVDKFNTNDDRLYAAMEHRLRDGGIWTSPTTSGPTAEELASDMPEVEYAIAASWPGEYTVSFNDATVKTTGRFAGAGFFKMFSYDLTEGSEEDVLKAKNSLVISQSLAIKLFGTAEGVVGKPIQLNHDKTYFVSGVYRNIPLNATTQVEFVGAFEDYSTGKQWLTGWNSTGIQTLVLLKKGTDLHQFNKKIANFVKVKTQFAKTHRTLFLKKYSENYLYGKYENGKIAGGRIEYVKLFSIIAVFILIIACINFMNLSTAKASRRIKEVGIKKALGAGRHVLMVQYLGEALLVTFIALATAMVLVAVILPQFNIITGKQLHLHANRELIFTVLSVTLVTGIIAGSYPALYLSGFNPGAVLKGKLNTSFGEVWARKGLVVFQFVLSIVFIVGVVVVYEQVKYVQSANLGYNKENIIYFPREGRTNDPKALETFLEELKNIPGVVAASTMGHNLRGHNSGTSGVVWPGKNPDDKTEFENMAVNFGMMEALNLTMASGRMFSPEFPADTAKIIFNEVGIKFMGLTDPIGKTIKLWDQDMQIIGVVKNFNFETLHTNVKPLFIRLSQESSYLVMVKLAAGDQREAISKIHDFYQKINPGFQFDYKFLDEQYQSQYAAEQRVATLSKYFAFLAILISCLGLFGLAAFTAERRIKEIGIRKVLGSSVFGIVLLLSKEFTRIVSVAILIALPLSYWLTREWLSNYAFRITPAWWYFASAALVALVISWITVGMQAMKVAKVSPVVCLKDE